MAAKSAPRCGIVGAGRRRNGLGPFLARDLEAAGAQVVAIAGRDVERTASVAAGFADSLGHDVVSCGSVAELLAESLDALVIAAPIDAHRPALEAALEVGLPVLCEKPLVSVEQHGCVPELLAGFGERGLLVMENCQWPYALGCFDELYPGLLDGPVERIEMLVSPTGQGRDMVVDSLSHFLSVLQRLLPVDTSTQLRGVNVTGCEPDTEQLELVVELESPFPTVSGALYLRRCADQPRPAWVAVNGSRVERQIDPQDYSMSFTGGGRTIVVEDPMTALVRQFVHLLMEPDLDRARTERRDLCERARLYAEIFAAWGS